MVFKLYFIIINSICLFIFYLIIFFLLLFNFFFIVIFKKNKYIQILKNKLFINTYLDSGIFDYLILYFYDYYLRLLLIYSLILISDYSIIEKASWKFLLFLYYSISLNIFFENSAFNNLFKFFSLILIIFININVIFFFLV
jgi:hypothetical protein